MQDFLTDKTIFRQKNYWSGICPPCHPFLKGHLWRSIFLRSESSENYCQ